MEDIKENMIYFIYAQRGSKNNIAKIETNNIVENYTEKQIQYKSNSNCLYILYSIQLASDFKGKPFALTLIDKSGELYYKNIFSKDTEKFKYDMIFESYYEKNSNLNQIPLSYKEQFFMFKNSLEKEITILNDLFSSTVKNLSKEKNENIDHSFLFSLFLEIYKMNKQENDDSFKNTLKNFFEYLNLKILEIEENNSEDSETLSSYQTPSTSSIRNLDINSKDLEILSDSDTYKLRNELISMTGNIEKLNEKIDVFLALYYMQYKPKLFICFLDTKKDKFEEIKNHLINNKKLFNNFNTNETIITIMDEANNLDQLLMLINNFIPNLEETLKLISKDIIFFKFSNLTQIEKKNISIFQLSKPKKTDNLENISTLFENLMDLTRNIGILPIHFKKDFFMEYCKTFMNEDLNKIKIIQELLSTYNKTVSGKSKLHIHEEINEYYHETGMFLINNKKLRNQELINFLKEDDFLSLNENAIPIKDISNGIIFDEKDDSNFANDFLNDELNDFNMKEFFKYYYNEFIKNIFDKFRKPRDLVAIKIWQINSDTEEEVLKNFLLALKRIWIADPTNHMYALEKLIARALGESSHRIKGYLKIIKDIEKKVASNLIMPIYSELLYRDYPLTEELKDYITNYIQENCNDSATSIWYLINTFDDNDEKINYLEKHLNESYAVIPENFINYPKFIHENIFLFTRLYNGKFFRDENLTKTPYYKISISSKNNLGELKFLDAMTLFKKKY